MKAIQFFMELFRTTKKSAEKRKVRSYTRHMIKKYEKTLRRLSYE